MAYNTETILAEKLETIISRSDQNTRPRDFYDVYVLQKLQSRNIDLETLREAIAATSEKRNTLQIVGKYKDIIEIIRDSSVMKQRWESYQKDFEYAKDIEFEEVCDVVSELMYQCNTHSEMA